MKDLTSTSKFLAMVLRHRPDEIGIELDGHGWAEVGPLLKGMKISMADLEEIVATDGKKRYAFNEDKTKIRANQGHSVPVDVDLQKAEPPEVLYHGTSSRFLSSIMEKGILPMSRLYVHLSEDPVTAMNVGKRHGGEAAVVSVDSGRMAREGIEFLRSANGVWLVKSVPPEYFKKA
ncbi:MAG: RNA 2'-phosphotransferase [Clostridia bacterium]|nr:RNA 2'-phosphotransferase [Clostridia bacterium]